MLDDVIMKDETICTTSINVYELLKGIKWKDPKKQEPIIKYFLNNLVIKYIDSEVIEIAANIYADLKRKGFSIGDSDILIAATVITNKGTLITNNTKHFDCITSLKINNWI